MPSVSTKELKRAVISGKVGAITIDTSIVERHQFGFEAGVLALMSQFSRSDVAHLIPDIVLHEITAHLKKESILQKSKATNALKPLGNSWGIDKEKRTEALRVLFGEQSGEERTQERLQEFLDDTSATVLSCAEFVSIGELLSRFTETKPPFGTKEAKKNEFPDAVALLALEGWARKNDTTVVAVSTDGDWKQFCASSDLIYIMDNLAHALSVFQSDADEAADLFKTMLLRNEVADVEVTINEALNFQSDKIEIHVEAYSQWSYDEDAPDISFEPGEPLLEQIQEFDVVEYESNTLVIQTTVSMNVTAAISFGLDQWDSIDREYLHLGNATRSCTKLTDLNLILTIVFENGSASIDHVELLPTGISMDFGELEPDWMHGPDDHDEMEEEGSF